MTARTSPYSPLLRPLVRRLGPSNGTYASVDIDFDETRQAVWIDLALIATMILCFGSVTSLVMKVQLLKQAPTWAVYLYFFPIAAAVIAAAAKPHVALRTALTGGPFFLFVLWAMASFQWSNQPDLSLRQGILFGGTYLVACMMAQYLSWMRIGRILVGVFSLQALFSATLAVLKPEWGVMTEIYPGSCRVFGALSRLWESPWQLGSVVPVAMC